uniref:Ankyrin repeat domain 52 n=1 Tax=Myripristis murdjan TaxID=586833 RepID=A0A668AB57_9TELE
MGLRNITDESPLVQAIFSRNAEEVTLLLCHKENVDSLDQEQSSPLHAAAYLGDIVIMDLLITSGASVNAKDQGWLTPLHRAAASRNEKAVGLLLKRGAEVNSQDKLWHTPLHVAAANWATRCAEAMISHMCSVNIADRSGRTALHHAAHRGHGEMVNLLLNKGANVSATDKEERQPIHWAAYLGHVEVVKLLVSHRADAMCKDKHGYTPLHAAAASGQLDVVKYLLRLGIDEANAFGNTALHMACHTGQEAVAGELVNCGANVSQPNHHGYTPLHLATVSSNGALCLELLINNGADVNVQSKEGKSPLHMAAIHGRFTRSQILIQNGGEINCVDVYGNTPLHVAARYGHELLISTLMTNGADTSRQGIHGMLPLHLAVLYGFSDCCRKLLSSAGFDINTPDNLGRTCLHAAASGGGPLHYAAANGNSQCTIALVRAGAEVNELDLTGCSPLHYAAASHTFRGCLEYLLDNGSNPTLKNGKGYSAVHYAAAYGNKQHLELVSSFYDFPGIDCANSVNVPVSPLHLAAYNGHCEALRLLSETLVSLDVRDIEGRTALHLAAQRGFTQCVEVLLKHQASCTLKDYKHKWTPLHTAAAEGQMDCLLILVNRKEMADIIDSTDDQGQTALMLAALGSHTDCVHILLEKGAQADAADRKGRTALHRAAMVGSEDCICALLEHGASALCRDSQGRTPMHLAASCGHTELLRSLLNAATQADSLDSMLDYSGYTPTHWAAYHGHERCLDILLEKKLFSVQEGNPFTPLHCALINGHDGAAELLGKTVGTQMVNIRDTKGRTPLHAAAYSENVAGLQLVLAQGAEVNAVDHSGRSALMVAAENGLATVVQVLLYVISVIVLKFPLCLPNTVNNCTGQVQNDLRRVCLWLFFFSPSAGHTPALACAPNKNVADCLALILSTMKPFPPREASTVTTSHLNPILKQRGMAVTCGSLANGKLGHTYVKDCQNTVGVHGCLTE